MALVVPNAAEVIALKAWVGKTAAANPWSLRLFSNNHTPVAGDAASDYTVVAGGGYANISLVAANWVFTPNAPSSMSYAAQTFAFTGATNAPGTIYGYYIVDNNGVLMLAELLPVPFVPAVNGDSVTVTPVVTLGSVFGD